MRQCKQKENIALKMATEECQNISLSLSDSSSESFYQLYNYDTRGQNLSQKIREKINKISLKINFNEVCLKNDLLPKFTTVLSIKLINIK